MSYRNIDEMHPYFDEGYKILREKFGFGAHEARRLLDKVWLHLGEKPHIEDLKNPRRLFFRTLRGFAARRRREEKERATQEPHRE